MTRKPALASRIINALRKEKMEKVVDIEVMRSANEYSQELDASIITQEKMNQLDPLHAIYVYAQNQMSVLAEQLSELPALYKLGTIYENAHEDYSPQGPPISPLTASYFTCWSLLDLNVGIHKESFGSLITEVCKELNADKWFIKTFETMNASRMGLYIHEGFSGKFVFLREFITENRIKAIVPSGHIGNPGEIWFVRVLPPPLPELGIDYSLVFITPYVIGTIMGERVASTGDEQGWSDYFDRTLKKIRADNRIEAYEQLMKYGLNRHYWNEYIFEAYFNHNKESILLVGFPDIPLSRPHSEETQKLIDGS